VKALLRSDPGIEIVGEADNGKDGLRLALELAPDIAVLDMSMPGLGGIAVARRLRELHAPCKVVALTVHEEPTYLRSLLQLGMGGYVLKRSAASDLLRAIRAVAEGGIYFDPAVAGSLLFEGAPSAERRRSDVAVELSPREIDVLRMTAQGHPNKVIAARLGVGEKTVETYKTRAMDKLGFESRVEIIRYAADRGWLGSG
jgi:DNA-binding NarL/FixJ family response regulator